MPLSRVRGLAPLLLVAPILLAGTGPTRVSGQDRLKRMPGYERYQRMSRQLSGAVKLGTLTVTWKDGGKAVEFLRDGKKYRCDLATRQTTSADNPTPAAPPAPKPSAETKPPTEVKPPAAAKPPTESKPPAEGKPPTETKPPAAAKPPVAKEHVHVPARGRQFDSSLSPDGKRKAFHRDNNLWLSDPDGANAIAVTTDGNPQKRIKYGTGSWVYGEELFQNTAMWWSPDSKKIAFYRFDESQVPDYFLTLNHTKLQSTMDAEPYPKAGVANPIVELFIYDLATKATVQADVRDGKPFDNSVVGHYVYRVSWSADSSLLLFNRTNRRQNIMEFTACDPATGKCRVIVREEWLPSWTENSPPIRFLSDNRRFIWTSERTGWKNLYLYDLGGTRLATLTAHPFEVANIVRVDEAAGQIDYMARSGDNPLKLQLHRVGLDGKGDKRLTDPAFHHTVDVAPDGRHFVDIAQTHDRPPVTRLVDADGKVIEELAQSDTRKFDELGLQRAELIRFRDAADTVDLYGLLRRPSNFDPQRKYPLLVSVYAGPATNGAHETFTLPSALTELGFLVASFDSRSAAGRGKKFLDAIYLKLGTVEMDDQAAGVRSLWSRPYLDKHRVGIFGASYGGYASVMCLLRHPDVFQAACASSAVTDFRLYDTIYTERYMWLPQENQAGYDAGSAMRYADKLRGRLMLFFGTADNNVHPSNSLQLIQALQKAGKSFDVQIGPDVGHSGIHLERMLEFFLDSLVARPDTPPPEAASPPPLAPLKQP